MDTARRLVRLQAFNPQLSSYKPSYMPLELLRVGSDPTSGVTRDGRRFNDLLLPLKTALLWREEKEGRTDSTAVKRTQMA